MLKQVQHDFGFANKANSPSEGSGMKKILQGAQRAKPFFRTGSFGGQLAIGMVLAHDLCSLC